MTGIAVPGKGRYDEVEEIAKAQFARAEEDLQRFVADPDAPEFTSYGVTLEDLTRKLGEAERYLASVTNAEERLSKKVGDIKVDPRDIERPGAEDRAIQTMGRQQSRTPTAHPQFRSGEKPQGGGFESAPLPPRDPGQGGYRDYVPPPAQFSPALLEHLPTNDTEAELWLRQATDELKGYYDAEELAYLEHMAQQGRMDDYMLEQMSGSEEATDEQRLQLAAQMMPFVGPRTPQLRSLIGMEMQRAASNPKLSAQLAPVQRDWDTMALLEQKIPEARERMAKGVEEAVRGEKRDAYFKYIEQPAREAVRGTAIVLDPEGQPERIGTTLVRHADENVKEIQWRLEGLGWSPEEAKERAEMVRKTLLREGHEATETMLKKLGLEEGAAEWFVRRAAHFVGLPIGVNWLMKGGKVAAGAARLLDRAAKSPIAKTMNWAGKGVAYPIKGVEKAARFIDKTFGSTKATAPLRGVANAASKLTNFRRAEIIDFMAGPAGLYAWALALGPGEGAEARVKEQVPEGPDRDAALAAAAHINGLMSVMMLPILRYTEGVGHALTFGMTRYIPNQGAKKFVQASAGFLPTTEAATGVLHGLRSALMSADVEVVNEALKHTFAAFPDAPGMIEGMSGAAARWASATHPKVREEAAAEFRRLAREFGAEMLPTMAGMGAGVAMGVIGPRLVDRSTLNAFRKDIRETLTGEERKQAEAIADEIEANAAPRTPEQVVAESSEPVKDAAKEAEEAAPVEVAFQEAAEKAYEQVAPPEQMIQSAVDGTGANITNPREAMALWNAITAAVHKKHPRPSDGSVNPDAVIEIQRLGEAFGKAREEAVARASKVAEPPAPDAAKPAPEPTQAPEEATKKAPEKPAEEPAKTEPELDPETLERRERAAAIRDELNRARKYERKAAKEGGDSGPSNDLALAHRERARALQKGEAPRPTAEILRRLSTDREGAQLRAEVDKARGREKAAQAALDDGPALRRAAAQVEGRNLVEQAQTLQDAAGPFDDPADRQTFRAARQQVAKWFAQHAKPGDVLEGIGGPYEVVSATPTDSGGVHLRVRGPDGKEALLGATTITDLGLKPTGVVRAPKAEAPKAEPAPRTPIEKAVRQRTKKRQQRDTELQEEAQKKAAAETPEEADAHDKKVAELMGERKQDEAVDVLAEKLQDKSLADDPDQELPPQAKSDGTGTSRGPTDANNALDQAVRESLKNTQTRVRQIARVLRKLMDGEPAAPETGPEERFVRYWQERQKRYKKLPKDEAPIEAARDWMREEMGRPPASEPMLDHIEAIERVLKDINEMTDLPAAMEALVELQREYVHILSGPDAASLRFSPRGYRMLNRMESTMIRLSAGGSQAGHLLLKGVPEWSKLYSELRTTWPMMTKQWWGGQSAFSHFGAAALDRMVEQFTRDPKTDPKTWFGRMWDKTIGSPERWGGRLTAELTKELNLAYAKAHSILAKTIGPDAEWGKFLREGDRDERLFRALDAGPVGKDKKPTKEWAELSPDEQRVATEIRASLRQIWQALAPMTMRGRRLARSLATTERAIREFSSQLDAEQQNRLERAMKKLDEADGDADTDFDFSKLVTPKDQVAALVQAKKRYARLQKAIELHSREGGISEFIHHVAEDHGVSLASWIHNEREGIRAPSAVSTGAMNRRTGRLKASGRLKESVLASLSDYLPQAVFFYHRNKMLASWGDQLYGTERPVVFADLVKDKEGGDPAMARNRPIHWNGRSWQFTGWVYLDKNGREIREPRHIIKDGEKVPNPKFPKGARKRARLQDWAGRFHPWTSGDPAPPPGAAHARVRAANKKLFFDQVGRYARLSKAAKKVGDGDMEKGMTKLWEAYLAGPESPAFLKLPEGVRRDFLNHAHYLPPHNGEITYLDPRVMTASATIRSGGLFDKMDPGRVQDIKEALDKFAGRAGEMRLSFYKLDGVMSTLGKIANATKIGWWNAKTASNVLIGGLAYNAAMPFHPGTLLQASILSYKALIRWRAANKNLKLRPEDIVPGHEQSPFRAGEETMRTPKEELDKMTPEARAKAILEDEAIVAMWENPIFQGRQADMAREMLLPGQEGKLAERMLKWKVGEQVSFNGRPSVVVEAPRKSGDFVTVKVRQLVNGKPQGKPRTARERTKSPNILTQVVTGQRGYELIGAMEKLIRSQSFLAGYITARQAGRSAVEARKMGENATLYAHGIFNQMTASAFFNSPMGPFLGGIKSYAARQFGVALRSPSFMWGRYASVAYGLNTMVHMLGLGDVTNQTGTAIPDLPLVGSWWDSVLAYLDDELDEDGTARFMLEKMLKPSLLPIQFPAGESPGMKLVTGAYATAKEVASGNYSRALTQAGKTVTGAFEPWFVPFARKAMAPESPDDPGKTLFTPLLGDGPSYKLNQSGFQQLLMNVVSMGQQPEVWEQGVEYRLNRAREERSKGSARNWRSNMSDLIEEFDTLKAAGSLTEQDAARINKDIQALTKEGLEAGERIGTPESQRALLKQLRGDIAEKQMAPAQRAILYAGKKSSKIKALTRALKRDRLSWAEADAVARRLGGEQGFQKWINDPALDKSLRSEFESVYKDYEKRQGPQARR